MADVGKTVKSMSRRLTRWARRTGGAASEWWDEVNAIQRRRSEIRDLARERQQLLVEMGTKVYSLHRRGKVKNRDLRGDCERIEEIGDDVERLEREIAELKRSQQMQEPTEVEIEDESSVVAEEDIEEPGVEEPEAGEPTIGESEEPEATAPEVMPSEAGAPEAEDEAGAEDEPSGPQVGGQTYEAPDDSDDADLRGDEDEGPGDAPLQQPYVAPDDAEDAGARDDG